MLEYRARRRTALPREGDLLTSYTQPCLMVITMIMAIPARMAWTAAGVRRGSLAALPFVLSTGVAGVMMGVAYHGLAIGFTPSVLFSLVVYSATAQAVTLGLWATPLPVGAMVLACLAMNARYLVLGASLRQLFPDVPRRKMLPTLFLLADASWAMTVAESKKGRRDAGYLLGSSLAMAMGWVGGTGLGYALPFNPHGPIALAAVFLPLVFVASLLPTQWHGRHSVLPWMASGAVAMTAVGTLGASWAMLLGGGAGTVVSALQGDHG
jgi:predicted branched-subunit amino acid permease